MDHRGINIKRLHHLIGLYTKESNKKKEIEIKYTMECILCNILYEKVNFDMEFDLMLEDTRGNKDPLDFIVHIEGKKIFLHRIISLLDLENGRDLILMSLID